MLKNILSKESCAQCQLCCIFDKYDIWETPVVSDELYEKIKNEYPETEFIEKNEGGRILKCIPDGELFNCPMLDKSSGCRLGDEKPFDCRIWPYRIMEFGGKRVITIASICPEMYKKPLSELVAELEENGLAEKIWNEANRHPEIVKPYQKGYPILLTE
ncbi:MAG: YkgJ family cysteine cluster protein [Oscillospiraceae bacterium]